MKIRRQLALVAGSVGIAMAMAANAAVIFQDDFTAFVGTPPLPPAGNYNTVTDFQTTQATYHVGGAPSPTPGNIDFVDPAYPGNLCQGGPACIDLDGSGSGRANDYLYTVNSVGTSNGGEYQLTVRLGGSQRGQDSNVAFGFLNPNDATFPLTSSSYSTVSILDNSLFTDYTFNYTIAAGTQIKFFIENLTGITGGVGVPSDNVGAILRSVSVSAVPLPAAVWLLLSGLAGVGLIGRRRRQLALA